MALGLGVIAALFVLERGLTRAVLAQRTVAPSFQVDPAWPKMPPQWILGQVSGLAVE